MRNSSWSAVFLLFAIFAVVGCVPIPVSTVPLHPREERPVAVESALSENFGTYANPVFDADGSLLAVYDSGSDLIRIFRSANLSLVRTHRPEFRPRRLGFSPKGNFLVIQTHAGWIDDYLKKKKKSGNSHVAINSPEAVRDNIQRVEIWDLRTGQTVSGLGCDAVVTSEPKGGWLWASDWAITPGYRNSALLEAHFSEDEAEFSALCWNGMQQRWDVNRWERIADVQPPAFWKTVMGAAEVHWMAGNDSASRSADGRRVLLAVRGKAFGFPTIYMWDRNTDRVRKLPGNCGARLLPVSAVSGDGRRIVVACNSGMGQELRVWDIETGLELPLKNADFGFAAGYPVLRGEGVAMSPDGRFVVAAILGQMEALLPNVLLIPAGISRSDLRLWNIADGNELVSVPIDDLDSVSNYLIGVDLAFSPNSEMLAVSGQRLRIYRLSDLGARTQ